MLLESEGGIWAEADARVFAMLMAPNRTARRLLAAERTKGAAFRRVAALRILEAVLATAEQPSLRIEATGAPFDKRSILKSRGYRWDPVARVWWAEIAEHEETSETLWLHREVMPWGPTPRTRPLTWHERHR